MLECQCQRNTTSHRNTEDVCLLNAKCLHEPCSIVSHHFNRVVRVGFICATCTTIIECQDLIFLCKPMNYSMPLRYVGSKSNDQHQRLTVAVYFVIHLYVIDFYIRHICSISRLIGESIARQDCIEGAHRLPARRQNSRACSQRRVPEPVQLQQSTCP